MRGTRLRTLLIVFSLSAVVLAAGLVGGGGAILLRRLADEQATSRALLGAEEAAGAVERGWLRSLTAARLLSRRPTLASLVRSGDRRALDSYLWSFQSTSEFAACGVMIGDRLAAVAGEPVAWEKLARAPASEDGRFLVAEAQALVMGAWAAVGIDSNTRVGVAQRLDETYAAWTASKINLQVRILDRRQVEAGGPELHALLLLSALTEGTPVAARISERQAYLAAVPLRDPRGDVVGVVEASLAEELVAAPLVRLRRSLLLLTAVVGLLALLFSASVSQAITRPVERLGEAAQRIGRGELEFAVPREKGAEIGALASAMEEMRARILRLTRELRRRRDEAEAVLGGITEGVFAVDRERKVRYLNPQAAELLGVDPEAVAGRFCGDVLNPRGPDGERPCEESCPILHARFRGSARARERLLLPSGVYRSVVITSSPPSAIAVEGAADEPQQFQALRDETELEASRRVRDSVVANISHEFRSPLSAQLASLELLRDRLPELSREETADLILSLERGTLRLTRLIDNLLESTRIESGETSIRRAEVSLDHVVEEAVELVAPLIAQAGQELLIDLPYPMPPVLGDAPRLTQVLVNLLANANKFAPGGSTIRIGGEIGSETVALSVEDEGPGLPEGTREALFERWVRSPRGEPEQSGIGLGLWIVKSIVDRHGGRVEPESREIGTVMRIVLPRWRRDESPGG